MSKRIKGVETMNHICHAKGCATSCKPEYLMCPKHWRMVPATYQGLVYRHYQPGQCELNPLPTKKWHASADLAITAVAHKEKRISLETVNKVKDKCYAVLGIKRRAAIKGDHDEQ